jgi:hypothetical protein
LNIHAHFHPSNSEHLQRLLGFLSWQHSGMVEWQDRKEGEQQVESLDAELRQVQAAPR